MAGGINSFNLLNIDSTYKKSVAETDRGKDQLSVMVSDAGRAAITEVFALDRLSTTGPSRLTAALQTIVELSGTNINITGKTDEQGVLNAIGDHIMKKQGAKAGGSPAPLTPNERTLLQNLTILLKVARNVNNVKNLACFTNVERNNRYTYNEHKTPINQNRSPANRPQTAWTSWAEDALAFEEVRTDKSSSSKGDPFKQVGKVLTDDKHVEMLKKFSLKAAQKIDSSAATGTIGDETALKQNLKAQKRAERGSSTASPGVAPPSAPTQDGSVRPKPQFTPRPPSEPPSKLTEFVAGNLNKDPGKFLTKFNKLSPKERQQVNVVPLSGSGTDYKIQINQEIGGFQQKTVTKKEAVEFITKLAEAKPGKAHHFKIASGNLENTYIVGEDGNVFAQGSAPVKGSLQSSLGQTMNKDVIQGRFIKTFKQFTSLLHKDRGNPVL